MYVLICTDWVRTDDLEYLKMTWLNVKMCKAEGKAFKGMEWVKSDAVWREEEGLHMMTLNGDWFKMQIT